MTTHSHSVGEVSKARRVHDGRPPTPPLQCTLSTYGGSKRDGSRSEMKIPEEGGSGIGCHGCRQECNIGGNDGNEDGKEEKGKKSFSLSKYNVK